MDYLEYLFVMGGIRFFGWLPRRLSLAITKLLARTAFHLDRYHRRIMLVNLGVAFPTLSNMEKRNLAKEAFENLGRIITEITHSSKLTPTNIHTLVTYDAENGLENAKRAFAKGKGVLILTGHFSSWELLPLAGAMTGYPLNFVIRPLDNKYLDAFFKKQRSLHGNRPIPKKNAARDVLRSLKEGAAVGILIDQNTHPPEGVFVHFFGKLACTTSGLAVLALRTGAAVLPVYLVRNDSSETYRIVVEPEVELIRSGDTEKDILENTQLFTTVVENIIRRHPGQWLWGHRRWKTRPPSDPEIIYP